MKLPGDYGVHATLHMGNLLPYFDDDGLTGLMSIPFKMGGDDAVMNEEGFMGDEFVLTIGTEAYVGQ